MAKNPTKKSKPFDPEVFMKGIKSVESADGLLMMNPYSSATGFYGQLYNSIPKPFLESHNITSRDQFAKDTIAQKKYMMKSIFGDMSDSPRKTNLFKDAEDLYSEYSNQIEGFDYRLDELAGAAHFAGRQGARKWLAGIRDNKPYTPPGINKTVEDYLKGYNEAIGDQTLPGRASFNPETFEKGGEIMADDKKKKKIPKHYRGLLTDGEYLEYNNLGPIFNNFVPKDKRVNPYTPVGLDAYAVNAEAIGDTIQARKIRAELNKIPKLGNRYAEVDAFSGADLPRQEFGDGGVLSGILGGAATGASVGSIGGPWGTAIGGLVGGIAGAFTGGQEEELVQPEPVKRGFQYSNYNVNNMYQPTFPLGGLIPYTDKQAVELEKNEVYKQPSDNRLVRLPSSPTHERGGEDLNLEVGTKVLGELPDKVTGGTFKEFGTKLAKQQEKILKEANTPGTIAANTDDIKLAKINREFDSAFERQEKLRMGGKVKKKMYDGGGVSPYKNFQYPKLNYTDALNWQNYYTPPKLTDPYAQMSGLSPLAGPLGPGSQQGFYAPGIYDIGQAGYSVGTQIPFAGGMAPNTGLMPQGHQYTQPGAIPTSSAMPGRASMGIDPNKDILNQQTPIATAPVMPAPVAQTPVTTPGSIAPNLPSIFDNKNNQYQGFDYAGRSIPQGPTTPDISLQGAGVTGNIGTSNGAGLGFFGKAANTLSSGAGNLGGLGNILGTAAQLAPVAYNLIQGSKERDQLEPEEFYNPEYDRAISNMSNRRFNVDPLLEANRNAAAIGRYNLQNAGAGAGQVAAGTQSLAASRMRNDAAAWAQKNNMDNQYLAEEGRLRAQLGSEEARIKLGIQNINDANLAAGRSFLGQGFQDIGQFGQMQQLMANQRDRDAMLLELYPDMFGNMLQYQPGMQNILSRYRQG
jgi:hypothetical protein